jgi:hypothetical protein
MELHETIRPTVRSKPQVNEPLTAHISPWEQLNSLVFAFSPILSDHWPATGFVFSHIEKKKGYIKELSSSYFPQNLFAGKTNWTVPYSSCVPPSSVCVSKLHYKLSISLE